MPDLDAVLLVRDVSAQIFDGALAVFDVLGVQHVAQFLCALRVDAVLRRAGRAL